MFINFSSYYKVKLFTQNLFLYVYSKFDKKFSSEAKRCT